MKRKQLINNLEQLHAEDLKTVKKKNSDYADGEDPFQNFRMVEDAGLCTVETGFLVRMSDKMQRAMNLLGDPERQAQVEDENVTDTLSDLRNYAALLQLYLEDQQQQGEDERIVRLGNGDAMTESVLDSVREEVLEETRPPVGFSIKFDSEDDRIRVGTMDDQLSNLLLVAKELGIEQSTEEFHDLKYFYQDFTVLTKLVDEYAQTLRGGVQ